MSVPCNEPVQIVRPMLIHDAIPDLSTFDLFMPMVCHVAFAPIVPTVLAEPKSLSKYQTGAIKSHAQRRINLDKKYRALEPQIKAMREAGMTWYAVRKKLGINFHALEYCKNELGMAKYGEGK